MTSVQVCFLSYTAEVKASMPKSTETLETEVALLSQFNTEVVKPFIEEQRKHNQMILSKLENLDYIHRKEYETDQGVWREKFLEIEKRVTKRSWLQSTLASAFAVMLTLLVTYFIKDILGR